MEIKLEKKTSENVKKASTLLGIKQQDVVDRALQLYLDNISKYLDLKKELADWDVLSDEALIQFEKSL